MKWLRDAYRGFLWPYLTFLSAGATGIALETHSRWHWTFWPLAAIAIIVMNIAQARIRRGKS